MSSWLKQRLCIPTRVSSQLSQKSGEKLAAHAAPPEACELLPFPVVVPAAVCSYARPDPGDAFILSRYPKVAKATRQ